MKINMVCFLNTYFDTESIASAASTMIIYVYKYIFPFRNLILSVPPHAFIFNFSSNEKTISLSFQTLSHRHTHKTKKNKEKTNSSSNQTIIKLWFHLYLFSTCSILSQFHKKAQCTRPEWISRKENLILQLGSCFDSISAILSISQLQYVHCVMSFIFMLLINMDSQ